MKIEKLLVTAAGIGAIVGLLTPQISNAAVNIPHPVINISRPVIPSVKPIVPIARPTIQSVKPIVSVARPTIAVTSSHLTNALSKKVETSVKLNPKNEISLLRKDQVDLRKGLLQENKNKPANGGVVALNRHEKGGTSYNPETNTTTTFVWRPERDVGGGMKEKAHWEKIVETGNTTGNHNGKF